MTVDSSQSIHSVDPRARALPNHHEHKKLAAAAVGSNGSSSKPPDMIEEFLTRTHCTDSWYLFHYRRKSREIEIIFVIIICSC